jgi:Endonuclease/Exonuclease/phosphatase family
MADVDEDRFGLASIRERAPPVLSRISPSEETRDARGVRVLSWNLLAEAYEAFSPVGATGEPFTGSRLRRIGAELARLRPDVAGLQEVDAASCAGTVAFRPGGALEGPLIDGTAEGGDCPLLREVRAEDALRWGPSSESESEGVVWKVEFAQRSFPKEDGSAILYRADRWKVVGRRELRMKPRHVALLLLLEEVREGQTAAGKGMSDDGDATVPHPLAVVTTHLLAPDNAARGRAAQVRQLIPWAMSSAVELNGGTAGAPLILVGDFNATPSEEAVNMVSFPRAMCCLRC